MNVNQIPYRKIDALSASDIKLFFFFWIAFYHQKVLGEKRKDKFSDSLTLGTLIDFAFSSDYNLGLHFLNANINWEIITDPFYTLSNWDYIKIQTDKKVFLNYKMDNFLPLFFH